ncbi:Predicted oxidoreductase [Devosia crocina]|uniref:Predicted oxidoreductase n=1 Tax=Devosia crocina TaxID=429728 RepID=A0A1I7NUG2_9HYPH|nr:aldo/keto reductase [Devosia crocina]SFV38260.1 Predicted oxidoreductase [Devosia crocina]
MKTHLPTRKFGLTGMAITRVGIGAWAMGGNMWGPQDDADSAAAIRHAIERGINWIDTAAVYGNGHSETVIGKTLADIPASERPFVFTKGGIVRDENGQNPRRIGERNHLRTELENSLKRLGLDVIDLYQLHWPSDDVPLEEYWSNMLELKKEGKVRHVGLSNHDETQLARAEALGHVETLQPPFSMIRRETGEKILPWCAEHGTGVICYSPMQAGLLTGTMTAERVSAMPDNDWRKNSPEFQGDKLRANLALAERLKPIAERHGTSVSSVALAWCHAWPGLTATIVGARSPAQVDGWLDAASLDLNTEDLNEIARAIEETGAGQGPAKG